MWDNNITYLVIGIIGAVIVWYVVRLRLKIKEVQKAYNNLLLSHKVLKDSVKDIPLTYMPDPKEDVKPPVYRIYKVQRPPTAPKTDLYCPQEFIVAAESADAAVLICMNHYDLDEWWIAQPIPDSPQVITVVEKL